jgi:zinc transporter ZupT
LFTKADLARSLQEEDGHILLHDHEHEDEQHHEATSLEGEHEGKDSHYEHEDEHHHEATSLEDGHEGEDSHHMHDQHDHDVAAPKPWFYTILATVLVNVTSLSGLVLLLIPAIHRGYLKMKGSYNDQDVQPKNKRLFDICVPAFAVGALMSTAMFLVFPEALHLIEGAHSDEGNDDHAGHDDHRFLAADEHAGHDDSSESVNAAKFGCAVLGGFLLPIALGMLFPHHQHCSAADVADEVAAEVQKAEAGAIEKDGKASVVTGNDEGCDCCSSQDDVETGVAVREIVQVEGDLPQAQFAEEEMATNGENGGSSKSLTQITPVNWRLVTSVLVGDAFCNFVDGVFIGAAFLGCSWGTVFSIILVTLLHEIPQEVADFLILTRYAGLSTTKACVVNFTSGLSVTLGGIVVLATNTSDAATGIILAMAGGAYINISVAETVPRIDKHITGKVDRLLMLTFFIVGCVPIGLVLLKHEHC